MKAFYILLFLVSLSFTGCYTVLWTTDQEFPSESSYYGSYDGYYSDPYYGEYNYYYEYPWWLSFSPPTVSGEDEKTARSEEIRKIRNSTGERNSSTERIAPTTTRSSGSNSGSSSSGTNNSTTQTEVRSRNDNSSSSGSSNSGNRSETRNSGSRNSGNGRK